MRWFVNPFAYKRNGRYSYVHPFSRCTHTVRVIVIGVVGVGIPFFLSPSFRFILCVLCCCFYCYSRCRFTYWTIQNELQTLKMCAGYLFITLCVCVCVFLTYLCVKRLQQHSPIIHLVLYVLPIQSKTIVKSNFFSFSWKSLLAAAFRKLRTYRYIYLFEHIYTYIDDGCKWMYICARKYVDLKESKGAGGHQPTHTNNRWM